MCRAKVFNIFLYTFIKHSWSDLMSNKEYRNKWKDTSFSELGRLNILKISILHIIICCCNASLIRIPVEF